MQNAHHSAECSILYHIHEPVFQRPVSEFLCFRVGFVVNFCSDEVVTEAKSVCFCQVKIATLQKGKTNTTCVIQLMITLPKRSKMKITPTTLAGLL